MSRRAVSCEHFAGLAHFDEVSLPWKPSGNLLMIICCLSLRFSARQDSQNLAFLKTTERVSSTLSRARPRQSRNHSRCIVKYQVFLFEWFRVLCNLVPQVRFLPAGTNKNKGLTRSIHWPAPWIFRICSRCLLMMGLPPSPVYLIGISTI
jgi:hypothetical protein